MTLFCQLSGSVLGTPLASDLRFRLILKVMTFQKYLSRWWFQIFFNVHPYLGKIPILTNLFQMGWNHQLVFCCSFPGSRYFFFVSKEGSPRFSHMFETHPKCLWVLSCHSVWGPAIVANIWTTPDSPHIHHPSSKLGLRFGIYIHLIQRFYLWNPTILKGGQSHLFWGCFRGVIRRVCCLHSFGEMDSYPYHPWD